LRIQRTCLFFLFLPFFGFNLLIFGDSHRCGVVRLTYHILLVNAVTAEHLQ
jgi:hypothetical protein